SLAELIGVRVRSLPKIQHNSGRNITDYLSRPQSREVWPRFFGLKTNIDFLGYDLAGGVGAPVVIAPPVALAEAVPAPRASAYTGISSLHYRQILNETNPSTAETKVAAYATPQVPNRYEEQLSILSALGDTISVRSDLYIAWFVVHGYSKEDCNVAPAANIPLVPSVARRFVMVIDRSKVVRKGDKPEILLFKEVPYAPFQ
ncbi:MAG: hypothetical protein ACOYN0_05375, partial [Phycisphaerales bacterium]